MLQDHTVCLDFGAWGAPGWHEIDATTLRVIGAGAGEIWQRAQQDPRTLRATLDMMQQSEVDLLLHSISQPITPEWITRAVLITALRGLVLGQLPVYRFPDE